MAAVNSALRPFKVWSCDRQTRKAVVVSSFAEFKTKACERLGYSTTDDWTVVLECDGTEVEDDLYFNTLENGTVLLLVRSFEKWFPKGDHQSSQPCTFVHNVGVASPIINATKPSLTSIAPKPAPPHIIRPFAQLSAKKAAAVSNNDHLRHTTSINNFDKRTAKRSTHLQTLKCSSPRQQSLMSTEHDYFVQTQKETTTSFAVSDISIESDCTLETRSGWSYAATRQLIRLYKEFRPLFRSNHLKVLDVWKMVGTRMKSAGFDIPYQLCDKKFRNMKITYRTIVEKLKRGTMKSKKSWQYFTLMRDALTENPNDCQEQICTDKESPPEWLRDYFRIKKDEQVRELDEVKHLSEYTLEQLRKENESLHLLSDYLKSSNTWGV